MLRDLDDLIGKAIGERTFPSIEVLVATGSSTLAHGVWGSPTNNDVPLKFNSVFDVASVTKPVATATLLRQLIREGAVSLSDKVAHFVPAFLGDNKEDITLGQLAFHVSGLPADMPLAKMTDDRETAHQLLMDVALSHEPGAKMIYSCLGYILLGEVIEHVLNVPLERAFNNYVAKPLDLKDTLFRPHTRRHFAERIVPTVKPDNTNNARTGVVHDSTSRLLGGNKGNAGLFSTAKDLHKFALALLEEQDTLTFENGNPNHLVARTLGWELKTSAEDDCSCGRAFPINSIGHTGFTGTSLWIDPASELIVIALSNRTYFSHRENLPAMKDFRSQLHDLAAKTLLGNV
ncbi:serine hydrolase domain-containing protein [Maritalea sp.]|uniref:serine hydrolase domain-containing protein n=1 Tax=Maritalea sp. TaxID=2003361 RepID=UPI003EF15627